MSNSEDLAFCEARTGHAFYPWQESMHVECTVCGEVYSYKQCREGNVPNCGEGE